MWAWIHSSELASEIQSFTLTFELDLKINSKDSIYLPIPSAALSNVYHLWLHYYWRGNSRQVFCFEVISSISYTKLKHLNKQVPFLLVAYRLHSQNKPFWSSRQEEVAILALSLRKVITKDLTLASNGIIILYHRKGWMGKLSIKLKAR